MQLHLSFSFTLGEVAKYKTIAGSSESLFKDKASKFIGFAFPASTEEQIKESLDSLKEIHPKATHHCYAWRLGIDKQYYRANDDGEPSGSAGKPILGQIDSFGLSNVLIVVVRYYGGTKLGVPGLINAYREAAKLAIEETSIIEKETSSIAKVKFSYSNMNRWMHFVKSQSIEVLEKEFEHDCRMTLQIPDSSKEEFVNFADQLADSTVLWI